MARTKASVGAKVSSGKSSKARCSVAPTPSYSGRMSSGEKSSKSHSGGNSVCQRETPNWQKPITTFFVKSKEDCNGNKVDTASNSKPKRKCNVIESDDEEPAEETPKNKELDETLELEPLTGENSHKIDEYYAKEKDTKNDNIKDKKGKGKGKKSNKENVDNNLRRNSKRDLEDSIEEDEPKKKIKI